MTMMPTTAKWAAQVAGIPFTIRRLAAPGLLPLAVAAILIVIFSFLQDAFFTWPNAWNIARQSSVLLVAGMSATFVIILGCIDLSIGQVMTLRRRRRLRYIRPAWKREFGARPAGRRFMRPRQWFPSCRYASPQLSCYAWDALCFSKHRLDRFRWSTAAMVNTAHRLAGWWRCLWFDTEDRPVGCRRTGNLLVYCCKDSLWPDDLCGWRQ